MLSHELGVGDQYWEVFNYRGRRLVARFKVDLYEGGDAESGPICDWGEHLKEVRDLATGRPVDDVLEDSYEAYMDLDQALETGQLVYVLKR